MLVNIQLQKPDSLRNFSGGILSDFALAAFGRLEVVVNAAKPCTVEVCIGEVLTPDGRIDREPGGYRCFKSMQKEFHFHWWNFTFILFVRHVCSSTNA